MAPELYHMDMQAGAPPDDFAEKGRIGVFRLIIGSA